MGANDHMTVVPTDHDGDNGDEQSQDTAVAGVNDPVDAYSDDVIRRRFASKYSEVNVMGQRGANNGIVLARLLDEIEDRGLDPQRALDLHGVPNFVCPECDTLGLHSGRSEGVKRCDECDHQGTATEFEP
jgi:ribosomal protein L37AE/L43A